MTIRELCAAALQYSDNTAANLLLKTQGGPNGLTAYLRSIGDAVSRLDRVEPELNTLSADKDLDTTTPRAIAQDLKRLILEDALSEKSRALLKNWMLTNTTGEKRLKAGVPSTWKVADKTGTCGGGSLGDIAVLYPPSGSPIVVASYIKRAAVTQQESQAALANIAKQIAAESPP
jgi:beta-lactamase class A